MNMPSNRKEKAALANIVANKNRTNRTHQDDLKEVACARHFGDLDSVAKQEAPLEGELGIMITHDSFLKGQDDRMNVLTPWQGWDFGDMCAWARFYGASITKKHTRKDGTKLPLPRDSGNGFRAHWSNMERITARVREMYSTTVYTGRVSTTEYIIGTGELFSPETFTWEAAYLVWYVGKGSWPRIEFATRASSNRMHRVEPNSVFVPKYHYARQMLLDNHQEGEQPTGEITTYYVADKSLIPYINAGYRARVSKYMGFRREHWLAWYKANGVTPLLPFKEEDMDAQLQDDVELG